MALAVIGTVNGGTNTTITGTNALTVDAGAVVQGTSTVSLTGSALTINGTLNDGGSTAGTGTIMPSATGPGATGTIDASRGTLIAGTLTGGGTTGGATGAATLTGTNQVSNLGAFSASGLTFSDGMPLTVDGAVNGKSTVRRSTPGRTR